jgi:hypothetical protein
MQTWQILAICAAILVIAVVGWYAYQQSRSRHLRRRFGTEYDQAVTDIGDRRRAESELARRESRINHLKIRPLSMEDRIRFTDRWRVVQAQFVDDPAGAVSEAERLVAEIMRSRGYASDTLDERLADVSAAYPDRANDYREAHAIVRRHFDEGVPTEELRYAFVRYRTLFGELLGGQDEELKRAS